MLSARTDRFTSWLKKGLPELARFTPPAKAIDQRADSPWMEPDLQAILRGEGIDTDVCVLGAVARGYRVIVASDGVCSSADPTSAAMMVLDHTRFGARIETAPGAEILDAWPG